MAISLKEQYQLAQKLKEVSYHAPKFNTTYYKNAYGSQHSQGRQQGLHLFYDFYAMEYLWSFLGSGQLPKHERNKDRDFPDDTNPDIIKGKAHRFLPHAAVKTIDNVYEQVTYATADRLIGYLRAAVYQEFRYILGSSDWQNFYSAIVTRYNQKKDITKEDLDQLIAANIPDMKDYPDTVIRILRFHKIYNKKIGTYGSGNPIDTIDAKTKAHDDAPYDEVPDESPEVSGDAGGDAEALPTDEIPGREFGKYGGKGQPEAPYPQDWSGMSAFKDAGDLPKIPDDDDEDEKQPVKEALINIGVLKPVYKSAMLAGLTLTDILRGYNNIEWESSFGGKRWGAAVEALIKLINARKKLDMDELNHVIDHIYDMQHNSGSLLNKGPMYVSDDDLNRRYKVTDVARFIPYVSSLVKNLILRYQPYLRVSKEQADTEANMEDLLKSPSTPFTPEESKAMEALKFTSTPSGYQMGIRFLNKKGKAIGNVFYQLQKHKVGSFTNNGQFQAAEGEPVKYVVSDNYRSDVKAFDKFEEAEAYLKRFEKDYVPATTSAYTSSAQSQKDMYIQMHTKIRLPMDKEQQLLDINMVWTHSNKYYVGYMKGGNIWQLFAFSNMLYMVSCKNDIWYQLTDWSTAFTESKKIMDLGGVPHPNKEAAQKEIDAIKAGTVNPNATYHTDPYAAPMTSKNYSLEAAQVDQLNDLVKTKLPHNPLQDFIVQIASNGTYVVMRKKFHHATATFQVGQNMDSSFGKPFVIMPAAGTAKLFATWEQTYNYLNQNIYKLAGINDPSSVTQVAYTGGESSVELPSNSTSKAAYTMHAGITKAPTQSIRLTVEDENTLLAAGFKAKMVSGNVWYVHLGTGDGVKFFPNDTGKMVFAKFPSAGTTQKIANMLAWITSKYSPTVTQSPITTGASVTPPLSSGSVTKGIPAGIMFDMQIKNAGFQWDPLNTQYVDGNNTLKIAPDRTSVLRIEGAIPENIQAFTFKDLPSLIHYLKTTYPQVAAAQTSKSLGMS